MTHTTTLMDTLVDRYIAIWNESDAKKRQELIAQTWAEDAEYSDPALAGSGREGIDTMTAGFQASYPGHRFERRGEIERVGAVYHFGWALHTPAGEVLITGEDECVLAGNGLIQSITGTFNQG